MAVVHNDRDVQGIKIFGTTILLQGRESTDDKKRDKDQTAAHTRPEKIIPCPRCKSMETKFCYFNNYNVNQPRHFCKGCQRYWTAGGALRNVPVGAGRRKAKPPNCRGLIGGYPENCLYEASGVQQFGSDQELVMEKWQLAESQGGFRHLYPAKRRRDC